MTGKFCVQTFSTRCLFTRRLSLWTFYNGHLVPGYLVHRQIVEVKNADGKKMSMDKTLKEKTPNGTERQMEKTPTGTKGQR